MILFSEFPSRGPQIQVDRKEYHAGDMVAASCTVPTSSPTPALAWYINDEPVSNLSISRDFRTLAALYARSPLSSY